MCENVLIKCSGIIKCVKQLVPVLVLLMLPSFVEVPSRHLLLLLL